MSLKQHVVIARYFGRNAAVAEMERENIRVQTMAGREQKAREGKWNGEFAPYGYRKKLRQNGIIPEFSASFIKKIIDNPVYMGKIAYGRRRKKKKTGTHNETHVVEQSDFPVYEEIHDPEHAHILSGILKCPCCGKEMYGNIAKVGRKDNKTRYYYYCKNTVNATGHKCTFRRKI